MMPSFRRAGLGLGVGRRHGPGRRGGTAAVAPQFALFGAVAECCAMALVSHDTATHQ